MTLPTQPLRGDRQPGARAGRRSACLSAAWADRRPAGAATRDRRRAVCSWSAGYGALTETAVEDTLAAAAARRCDRESTVFKKGKVADQAALLEPRTRRIVTTSASGVAVPHAPTSAASSALLHQVPPSKRLSTRAEPLLAMPGIKSILNGGRRRDSQAETRSPLVKRKGGAEHVAAVKPATSLASLRKCETVLALTGYLRSSSSSSSIEPLQPVNRLRVSPDPTRSRTCSRCSSLLTLASGSRYSLCSSAGGFVPVSTSVSSQGVLRDEADAAGPLEESVLCKLCLQEGESMVRIRACGCTFGHECMKAYVVHEISEGAYDISCPDLQCTSQGVLQLEEIKRLAGSDLLEKHKKYRLNREVELDKTRTWCPRAGCETVCSLCPTQKCSPQSVFCPTCTSDFCSNCKLEWHEGLTCEEYNKQLTKEGKTEEPGIPFDSDLIKCCPMCNVPIEKDEGCAQMMCKRCKHVFCWYCLASLDDDFLLRHYDKGPCKNKLGHSRASVIWHRTQVIGIFAGFGILLLVASPLLLLAAPCIVCCKCRFCNTGTTKLDNEDEALREES